MVGWELAVGIHVTGRTFASSRTRRSIEIGGIPRVYFRSNLRIRIGGDTMEALLMVARLCSDLHGIVFHSTVLDIGDE